jgi:hypothetical protein
VCSLNVANADSSVDLPTPEVIARFYGFYDGVPLRRALSGRETLYAIDKARRLLGFAPQARWTAAPGCAQVPAKARAGNGHRKKGPLGAL